MRKSGGSALLIPLSYPPEGEPDSIKKENGFIPLYAQQAEPEDMQLDEFMIDIRTTE